MYKCFFVSCALELSIGPPWLERETPVCESPIPVPAETSTSQAGKGSKGPDAGQKGFFQPETLIFPDFPRKQDNKVIQIREEIGRKQEAD